MILETLSQHSAKELLFISPEIAVACLASLILLLNVFLKQPRWVTYLCCQATLFVALILSIELISFPSTEIFNHHFILDPVANVLKILLYVYGIFNFIYARKYLWEHHIWEGEYFILSLFSILGMMVLVSAASFLTLYLGVELLTLPLFALIAMARHDKSAPEAAMKYFVMSAIASAMLLYGISLIYGATGSFEIAAIVKNLNKIPGSVSITILCGMVFVICGLAFKFGAVPFHMWIPDVYQGSPTAVTLFIATLPKIAAFGMAIRIFMNALPMLVVEWQPLLVLISLFSLVLGNTVAIAQPNLKRMLAYSTIGHVGFIFMGLLAGNDAGYSAAFTYVIIYTLMILGAFGLIVGLSAQGYEAENISDYKGLGSTQPFIAVLMLIIMFSLAGIPPTLGFYAKFVVLWAAITAGYLWLAVVGVIFSVIAAFYYLRIIRVMFFEGPSDSMVNIPQKVSPVGAAFLSINGILLLGLGIYPTPIINLAAAVFP